MEQPLPEAPPFPAFPDPHAFQEQQGPLDGGQLLIGILGQLTNIVQRMQNSGPKGITIKIPDPPTFEGRADEVDRFIRHVQDAVQLNRHAFSTNEKIVLYSVAGVRFAEPVEPRTGPEPNRFEPDQ